MLENQEIIDAIRKDVGLPDLNKRNNMKKNLIKAGAVGVALIGASSVVSAASVYYRNNAGTMTNLVTNPNGSKTIQFFGDLKGVFAVVSNWKLLDMDRASATFPSGITISSIYVDCSIASPVTQLNANLKYCNGVGVGGFPGGSPTLINALDTTGGKFQITNMALSSLGSGLIPAGKVLYFNLDADPTDTNTTWGIIINFTVN